MKINCENGHLASLYLLKNKKDKTMKFEGALIKKQGVRFAIVVVKSHVLDSSFASQNARNSFRSIFPGLPIILSAQDSGGRFIYQGRPDIVKYLASISPSQIPWKTFTAN
jgi:hypothetical protein